MFIFINASHLWTFNLIYYFLENYVSKSFGIDPDGQNETSFENEDEETEDIRGLKLSAAFKGIKIKGFRKAKMEEMDEVDAGIYSNS